MLLSSRLNAALVCLLPRSWLSVLVIKKPPFTCWKAIALPPGLSTSQFEFAFEAFSSHERAQPWHSSWQPRLTELLSVVHLFYGLCLLVVALMSREESDLCSWM